jgi:hypothetical protein
MWPPLDFPPPEKSALTGDENADASRGTDGSNPAPSSGESSTNRATARECAGDAAQQLAAPPVIPDNRQ